MEKLSYNKCVICSARRNSNVLLAKFPLDSERCREWVKAAGVEDLAYLPIEKLHEYKYMCGSHFAPHCFNKKKNRLSKWAIPTKNLCNPPLPDSMLVEFPLHVENFEEIKTPAKCEIIKKDVARKRKKTPQDKLLANVAKNVENTQTNTFQDKFDAYATLGLTQKPPTSQSQSQDSPHIEVLLQNFQENQIYIHTYEDNVSFHAPLEYTIEKSTSLEASPHPALSTPNTQDIITTHECPPCACDCKKSKLRIKQLQSKLKQVQGKYKRLQIKVNNMIAKEKEEEATNFFLNRKRKYKTKPHARRFSDAEKLLALTLYQQCPRKAYVLLQQLFDMPSLKTVKRLSTSLSLQPLANENILEILQKVQNK